MGRELNTDGEMSESGILFKWVSLCGPAARIDDLGRQDRDVKPNRLQKVGLIEPADLSAKLGPIHEDLASVGRAAGD